MKENFKMNTSKQKAPRLDFWPFPSVKSIHKSMKMWLVIFNLKDQGQKSPNQIKLTWGCSVKKSFFDSLFIVYLRFFFRIFCVFWKGTMYGYLYYENGHLERLPNNVGFVPNLNINVENLHFYVSKTLLGCTNSCLCMHALRLRMQVHACVRRSRDFFSLSFPKVYFLLIKKLFFSILTSLKSIYNLVGP